MKRIIIQSIWVCKYQPSTKFPHYRLITTALGGIASSSCCVKGKHFLENAIDFGAIHSMKCMTLWRLGRFFAWFFVIHNELSNAMEVFCNSSVNSRCLSYWYYSLQSVSIEINGSSIPYHTVHLYEEVTQSSPQWRHSYIFIGNELLSKIPGDPR